MCQCEQLQTLLAAAQITAVTTPIILETKACTKCKQLENTSRPLLSQCNFLFPLRDKSRIAKFRFLHALVYYNILRLRRQNLSSQYYENTDKMR